MISIGWRNLRRDPMRMVVAILGVVFAVVLVTVEVGMLLGLTQNASLLIDRSRADIWVSTVDVETFDFATPIDPRKKFLIQSVEGVDKVEEYNVTYSVWKLFNGGNVNVQVVAFPLDGELVPELTLVSGSLEELHNQDSIIIDEGDRSKLGNPKLGDYVEVINNRARVVGYTRDTKSFTTTPYVFTSLARGPRYGWMISNRAGDTAIYFLVRTKPGQDVHEVCRRIEATVPDVEAQTRAAFGWRTQKYWLIETGVGTGFLAAALMGLMVGAIIVSQTLYAMTVERIKEFGVLKALGASMSDLSRVVLEQGMICGIIGLLLGLGISQAVSIAATKAGTAVIIPNGLVIVVALITLGLCSGASMVSIFRLRKVEPATVFRV